MLLREIQVILNHHTPRLKAAIQGAGSNQFNVMQRNTLQESITAVSNIPSLHRNAQLILDSSLFTQESTVINQNTLNHLQSTLTTLRQDSRAIQEFINSILPREPKFYFSTKIPTFNNSGTDAIAKAMDRIHLAFDQPVRRLGLGALHVTVGQPGSIWLEVAVLSGAGLSAIGILLKLGLDSAKFAQEIARAGQEQAKAGQERAKVESEAARSEQERHKVEQERLKAETLSVELERKRLELEFELHRVIIETEIHKLVAASDAEPDASNSLQRAIQEISSMSQETFEFRLQLNAPAEIAKNFPPEALPPRLGVAAKPLLTQEAPMQLPAEATTADKMTPS